MRVTTSTGRLIGILYRKDAEEKLRRMNSG